MVNFKKVISKLDGGYIAVLDKKSTKSEKKQVAQFSHDTKEMLGLGAGLKSEHTPLVEIDEWDESDDIYYPGPHKMHVFVLVLNNDVVGYMPIRWHWNIEQQGMILDAEGKPLESHQELKPVSLKEFLEADFSNEPKTLEGWGIEGILILPEWQRRGFGKILLSTALNYLGTNIREIAFDPPITEEGKALIRSLGINPEEVRLSPGL